MLLVLSFIIALSAHCQPASSPQLAANTALNHTASVEANASRSDSASPNEGVAATITTDDATTQRQQGAARAGAPAGQQTTELAELMTADWKLVSAAEGDLNRDMRPDAVGVFEKRGDAEGRQPRRLVIALREASGNLRKDAESARVVLCRSCGGMLGDPLLSLAVERGAVVVEQDVMTGGSETIYTHRFGSRGSAWVLLGSTVAARDRVAGRTRIHDMNYMTGAGITEMRGEKDGEAEAMLSRQARKSTPQIIRFADFDIERFSREAVSNKRK